VNALFKKQTTLEDRVGPDAKYFPSMQTARKFAYASCEPHYAERRYRETSDFSAHSQDRSVKLPVILCFCMSCKILIETVRY